MLLMFLLLFRAPTFEPQSIDIQPVGTVFYWKDGKRKWEVTGIVRTEGKAFYLLEEYGGNQFTRISVSRWTHNFEYPEWEIIYSP